MGGKPGLVARVAERARRRLVGLQFRQMWQLAVAVVLAATALFGGLESVDTKVTPVKPGEEFNDGVFTVTVDRATLVSELRTGANVLGKAKPGRRYLGVVAEVRNDGTSPGKLAGELDLRGHPDKQFVGVMRIADGSRIQTLGPGLTEQLAFAWELPESALRPGQSVTLRVWKKQFKERMVTSDRALGDSLTDYGEVVLPVRGQQ